MYRRLTSLMLLALFPILLSSCYAMDKPQEQVVEDSRQTTPTPPWPENDELGMANTQGQSTWQRCIPHLADANSNVYELSHIRSETMPQSPFAKNLEIEYDPTGAIPYTRHASNHELTSGNIGGQGTQFDALGHFAYLPEVWTGEGDAPLDQLRYYNGFTQQEVKPDPHGPLRKLGIENVPPIFTTAVLLDARSYVGNGEPLEAGEIVTEEDIKGMLEAQGLGWRGLVPGDVLYIYTGWSRHWEDPDESGVYYSMGPGLAYGALEYLEEQSITLISLDNPFTDPAPEGKLSGEAELTEGMPEGLPFGVHHSNLTQSGIHQIQNAKLAELANDGVWTSCTVILPSRVRGAVASPVRPIAIGAPDQKQ